MTYEQGEQLLKEMDCTSSELDMMWDFCVNKGHSLIQQLEKSGKGWRDLNPQAIKTLPREYKKVLGGNDVDNRRKL